MHELIALALPAGPGWLDLVRRAWDDGDAVLPLDPGAPAAHTSRLLAELAPTKVVEADGEVRRLDDGRPVEPGDAVVVASSGTTGTPKGAVHTHHGIEHAAFASSVACGVAADVRWLACLPLHHVGGFSVLTRAMLTGAPVDVHARFDAAAVDRAAAAGATHVSLVPAVLGRIDAPRWRCILLGGSAVPPERPGNTIATYGMTETFGGVVYDGLSLDGTSVRVVDADLPPERARPRLVDPGQPGSIELRCASMMRAYRDGTDPVGTDGWFRTGDLGSIDPDTSRLRVHGRADDLIITGGVKVWPGPVEDVLRTDERVADVAVVGRPDDEWGQRVTAVVVPAEPGRPPPLDALRDLVRMSLPPPHAPRALELADSLPRTSLGKIRRSAITGDRSERDHG